MMATVFDRFPDANDQASGVRRGHTQATFDDGRVTRRHIRAPGLTAWNTKAGEVEAGMDVQLAEQDSEEAVSQGFEPDDQPFKTGEPKRVARTYFRQASSEQDSLKAYLLFKEWDGWRTRRTLTIVQAKNRMQEIEDDPLTDEEWLFGRDRRAWLMNAGRDEDNEAYKLVVDGDTWGGA